MLCVCLGLGWPKIAVDGVEPVFTKLVDTNTVSQAQFSFYLQSDEKSSGELVTFDCNFFCVSQQKFSRFNNSNHRTERTLVRLARSFG